MGNMKSYTSNKMVKATLIAFAITATMPAFAQSAGMGMCYLITFVKGIIGGTAILAILLFVINSFFGKSALVGEIIEKVLIGCVVAGVAAAIVASTGLTPPTCA